ncbi:asparagine synthetase B (glutamine-hydrolyzing) [Streptomyces pseudovenezuelae]|uniref:Asparagine synthetase B (Glutamine-hydrolyzing) n=1 Tax=Streptomyces pseudovenezuelae TaxID=67350 RepID=A0ABT6LTQ3_9ACTN|nr:asparagine synthetase B (glutamine-hydrolyzing) [Streptomyces pseudovenezuelae]
MCRITGLAGADAVRHERTVEAMGSSQAHRGTEGAKHAPSSHGRAALAMNTLLIVDRQAMPGPYLDRGSRVLLAFSFDRTGQTPLSSPGWQRLIDRNLSGVSGRAGW